MSSRRAVLVHSLIAIGVFAILYFALDRSVAVWCRSLDLEARRFFVLVGQLGNSLPYLVALPLCWLFFRWKRAWLAAEACRFTFAATCASGITVNLVKALAGRLRPRLLHRDGIYGFDPFTLDPDRMSFPSGHSAVAVALAVGMSLYYPRMRLPLFALALLVCSSRVLSSAHYPSDVVLGAYLAYLVTTALYTQLSRRGLILAPLYARARLQSDASRKDRGSAREAPAIAVSSGSDRQGLEDVREPRAR